MLGHELRNPLGVILLAADVLEAGGPVDRQREVIRRHGRHLARLVDDLLDVSRVTTGKIILQRQPVDLVAVLARCVASSRAALDAQRLHLTFDEGGGPLLVDGDPVRLEQVFANLVTNAIKYTPAGGAITLRAEREGAEAVVRVRDTGVGLTREMLPRIFDLFTQVERTLDRSQGGLGIGLTLVRSLVGLHGGSVEADSAGPGRGSEFVVRLPLDMARHDAANAAADEADGAPCAGRRVLLVEDNPDSRELLKLLLEARGHRVDVASDGVQGVERAVALSPEVLIVDIGLPGLDGYGVAQRVRAHFGRNVLLVALTGYGQPEDEQRALAAGFDVHCTKPVDAARLHRLLAAAPPA
jgi:CheY-like chemotaxis protein